MTFFSELAAFSWMWIFPAVHVVGLCVAAHSVFHVRTPQGTIAWALALVFFPWLALPGYFIFGGSRLSAYATRMKEAGLGAGGSDVARAALLPERVHSELDPLFEAIAPFPWTHGTSAELLINGEATFDAIFAAIDGADTYVLIEFFTVKDDDLGGRLVAHLGEAVKRGVSVHFLYDEIGSGGGGKRLARSLRALGAQVAAFGGPGAWFGRGNINFRNHRKIVVVDGTSAFVGGHNVADVYLGTDKRLSPWRDTHVALEGPVVLAVQDAWLCDWTWASGERPALRWETSARGDARALVLPTGPTSEDPACALMFASLFAQATERLWITTPYFLPTPDVDLALRQAAKRGVDVRVLLPCEPDHMVSSLAALVSLKEHEDSGVRFYRVNEGFLHQKVVLVDDSLACIGTANLDHRSIRLNFEISVLLDGADSAAAVARMLTHDFASATELTKSEYDSLPLYKKFGARVAWLSAPLL